jgi:hypothetical protein
MGATCNNGVDKRRRKRLDGEQDKFETQLRLLFKDLRTTALFLTRLSQYLPTELLALWAVFC